MPKVREKLEIPHRTAAYELLDDEIFKLTLTEENKAEVFEYGLSKLNKSQHEASSILQNLSKWDPHIRSLFALRSSSTILNTPFRLVFPNADLSSFEETGLYVRQYMAVSYCWRSKDFLSAGYERHGSWPISKPFVKAIISEKDHPRVGIWMDQLCIEQTSSVDKQKSVAAMDIIYRSCIRLLVLLEDVFLDEEEVALSKKYDPSRITFDRAWRPPADEQAVFASFYNKVNAARWWERAWCFHEFNVNEPWSHNRQCHEVYNATFIMNGPIGSTVKIKWWTLHYIMASAMPEDKGQEIFALIDAGDREPGWRSSVMARHNGVSKKGCMLLEDKLSIMINTCGLALAYQGQALKSTDEILYISALLALAVGESYPLTMFDGRAIPKLNNKSTWFQRHLVADDISIPRFRIGGLHGIHCVSMQEIELEMVFLPPPAIWSGVKDEDLRPTYEIFPGTIATTRPTTHGPVGDHFASASRPDAVLDNPRRRFLAGCVMNGHAFTARLWIQVVRDVIGPNYNQGLFKDLKPNPSLLSAAQRFVIQLLSVSTLQGIPPPSTFTLEDAHLFLTWLTDPRSMYYISVYTYRMQCTIDGQGAFTTGAQVNEHFQDGPIEELRAAVPTDLLDAPCIPLRVWLLRPRKIEDGVGKWMLVGKAMLLGEPDLKKVIKGNEGRDDAVVRSRRVVVGG
ncbi:hypothetical protein BU25DRAFT_213533 [Macroventuria anomochaeta]|uniref:Uncharacterized protein n=1 Tax=Macroventuria anomochaeta TaxID=301207 RepID=A0ACB6RKC5_9PLEO|nr:uncharacterized protein BU25DRAFT_213533 [Macroventuria anomochaeta]KAF2622248.1 hypothetical protein BU25DRAFT_213533 [Macroventuria anomochaeta]